MLNNPRYQVPRGGRRLEWFHVAVSSFDRRRSINRLQDIHVIINPTDVTAD